MDFPFYENRLYRLQFCGSQWVFPHFSIEKDGLPDSVVDPDQSATRRRKERILYQNTRDDNGSNGRL